LILSLKIALTDRGRPVISSRSPLFVNISLFHLAARFTTIHERAVFASRKPVYPD
jgi:hypothetical protein